MANVTFIKVLADLSVASKQHVMPPKDSWKAPAAKGFEEAKNYHDGVGASNWGQGYPAADGLVTYFATQDNHKYHFDTAKEMTQTYKKFISTQIDAVSYAFNIWRLTLTFSNLKVNGPCAVGSKGCLGTKTDFFKLFKTYPGHAEFAMGKHYSKWRDAVGKGVNQCLKNYVDSVMIPGFPWYPAFAAFPGPVAPPMPNITWPLIACPATGLADITTPEKLKKAMLNNFDNGVAEKCHDDIHKTIFEAIATSLSMGFLIWVSTQTINMVMSTGNIPTFAPPFVPVGPVVNGQSLPGASHLLP
ncbi:MAG: hypothetical protein IJ165_14525 [Proteobacteria bacterium]|nr:hypothetical protein [Pseudomonadota bacterium]